MELTTKLLIGNYQAGLIRSDDELNEVLSAHNLDAVADVAAEISIKRDTKPKLIAEIMAKQRDLLDVELDPPSSPSSLVEVQSMPGLTVSLNNEPAEPADGDLLSRVIRARSVAIGFEKYQDFINNKVCVRDSRQAANGTQLGRKFSGTDAFDNIKKLTDEFLRRRCDLQSIIDRSDDEVLRDRGVDAIVEDIYNDPKGGLHYYDAIARQLLGVGIPDAYLSSNNCAGVIASVARGDCVIELIWSYWYEEAMLVQTMQAIAYRFQNRRRGGRDPLASLEIDPLRPLNNIIWGYVQDESDQLSVARRAYEYDHHYGLRLKGRAVGEFNPVDSRVRFLEAFHHLLYLATVYFKEDNDNTYSADGFPILTALQELHVILAEAAHNQYGELPSQARSEMLIMQWILGRPEIREFLPGRASVPYREPWMGRVEAMRTLQGWPGASINHFSILAEFGERLLLSVRLRNWMEVVDRDAGANWADFWRSEIQQYVHSYRAVTGVDLAAEATTVEQLDLRRMMPSKLIERAAS